MCLSLYDYQSKASRHKKGLTYTKNRTSIQKHTIYSQNTKRREQKHKTKVNIQTTTKGTKKKQLKSRIGNDNKYICINITLKVNELNALIKRHRVADCIKSKNLQYTACKRTTVVQKTHIN